MPDPQYQEAVSANTTVPAAPVPAATQSRTQPAPEVHLTISEGSPPPAHQTTQKRYTNVIDEKLGQVIYDAIYFNKIREQQLEPASAIPTSLSVCVVWHVYSLSVAPLAFRLEKHVAPGHMNLGTLALQSITFTFKNNGYENGQRLSCYACSPVTHVHWPATKRRGADEIMLDIILTKLGMI
ncbi:hypothetical protein ACJJTC_016737 [Scirpophaga incertulas]